MGHYDQGHGTFFMPALLDNRFDTDVVVRQDPGNGGENARIVHDGHPEIITAAQALHGGNPPGPDLLRQIGKTWHPVDAVAEDVPGNINHIRGNRTAGRHFASPLAIQQNIPHHVPGKLDPVKGATDVGQQVLFRNHGRMHPGLHRFAMVPADGQKLDAVAELPGKINVNRLNPGDSFNTDIGETHLHAVSHGHQDHQLVSRIDALDIIGGIGLGIAFCLGLLKHLGKSHAFIGHLVENIVGCPVHDAHDRENLVGNQTLFQSLDHRDTAADAGLKADFNIFSGRGGKDLHAVLGDQGLVGGNHMLAMLYGLQNKGLCRFNTADELDHDVDLRVLKNKVSIPNQLHILKLRRQGSNTDVRHTAQPDGYAGFPPQPLCLLQKNLRQTTADGAKTK